MKKNISFSPLLLSCLFLLLMLPLKKSASAAEKHFISVPGYALEVDPPPLQPSASSLSWNLKVHGEEEIILIGDRLESVADEKKRFLSAHQLAGPVVSHFLRRHSDTELEKRLQYLTQNDSLSLKNLNRSVDIQYLANGWSKVVYRVIFQPSKPAYASPTIILKISKKHKSYIRAALYQLKIINERAENVIPRLGNSITGRGHIAYFEEFIPGVKLNQLIRDQKINVSTFH